MNDNDRKLIKRSDKVSFLGCVSDGEEQFNRMRGFTTLSTSKNATEYSRRYVDEEFETTDVTGYSPSIDFGFDQYINDAVHTEMVEILDNEKLGTEARRNIVTVDFSKEAGEGSYNAVKREYGLQLRPIETNVFMDLPGTGIFLYDLSVPKKIISKKCREQIVRKWNYFMRERFLMMDEIIPVSKQKFGNLIRTLLKNRK